MEIIDKAKAFVAAHPKLFMNSDNALMEAVNIVLALVMIVIVGAIGIFIAQTTITATGTPTNSNLSAMQVSILGSGQTGASFIVILIIAAIGGLAIAYLMGMLGGRRKGL